MEYVFILVSQKVMLSLVAEYGIVVTVTWTKHDNPSYLCFLCALYARFWDFFSDSWSLFDFAVVIASIASVGSEGMICFFFSRLV